MQKIIMVEGYRAFTGWMRISWPNKAAQEMRGDWLYRPDTDCWYGKGQSFPAAICSILEVQ
jgi:hypothetical protein